MHDNMVAACMAAIAVCAVYSKDYGYSVFVSLVVVFFTLWFALEHFTVHTDKW